MNQDDRYLAGRPSGRLIKSVRSALWRYGIRPTRRELWLLTWEWASQVADSYILKRHWPPASEIATQYVVLLLAEMREWRTLRLPFRAAEQMPPAVLAKIQAAKQVAAPRGRAQLLLADET